MIRAGLVLLFWMAGPVAALDLTLPSTARLTVERDTAPDIYEAPVGVFKDGEVPVLVIEGDVERAAWRIDSPGLTPLQVMQPLRAQLSDAGFDVVLDCPASTCGGFDFRFATEILPGPNMYVNIRRFHFVTAVGRMGGSVSEVVTVLTSTSASSAYVQIIRAGNLPDDDADIATTADLPVTTRQIATDDLTGQLLRDGHVVLSDLDFPTGSTELGPGPFASLAQLAAFLETRPDLRIALVGHTDTVGGLPGNIALSKERAAAVRQRLITAHDVADDRLDSEGMGYLSPVASNLGAKGRDRNRRVEAVLLGSD